MTHRQEYGDYQTPCEFADKVCTYLLNEKQLTPQIIVEPTCGIGNFLASSMVFQAQKYIGVEINPAYCELCSRRFTDSKVVIINQDFFSCDLSTLVNPDAEILIVGNPPWVTNSTLSAEGSNNLPQKSNIKGLKGIDAVTGASNFDICEFVVLHLIDELCHANAVLALLCKTTVARNVFKELHRRGIGTEYFELLEFDAAGVFDIHASACVMVLKLSRQHKTPDVCNVYSFEQGRKLQYAFGFVDGRFYSKLPEKREAFDGQCCFEWRQGVKHDCAKVVELTVHNGCLVNGIGEKVEIEDELVFPLVKSSMFKAPVIDRFTKYVVVTQKKTREETGYIQAIAPKTWSYLNENRELFNNRKSSIYQGAPAFSMFGIGDYSYAKYKVGVSGFYKKPLFSVLYEADGKPVMTDDTSYFIGFDTFEMAYVAMLLLNSEPVQTFLGSIAFLDAKRPYTKKVLERLSFRKMFKSISYQQLHETENSLHLKHYIDEQMYQSFQQLPVFYQEEQIAFA